MRAEQMEFLDETTIELHQSAIAGGAHDVIVELDIDRIELGEIAILGGQLHLTDEMPEMADMLRGDDRRQQGSGKPGQSSPEIIDLDRILFAEALDEDPAIGNEMNKAQFRQGAAGLTHRPPADRELVGDGLLIQTLAGSQLAA